MDRRTFVTLVAGTCLLEPLTVRVQQAGKVFMLGNDLRKRGYCNCGFNDAESGSGLPSHAGARQAASAIAGDRARLAQ